MPIKTHTPISSSIHEYAYTDSSLFVTFKTNPTFTYQYHNVPESIYSELQFADSAGSYISTHITNCFDYTRHEAFDGLNSFLVDILRIMVEEQHQIAFINYCPVRSARGAYSY